MESYRQREVHAAEDVSDRLQRALAVAEEAVANAVLRLLLNRLGLSEEGPLTLAMSPLIVSLESLNGRAT